ncbi:MAG: type I methionyl aminopeptidase [Bacillati bacterium ANGP1]|uniref:Methionine aminopeptidase n=1 Tax=Candidatus Segetimicrobium genomatis TaxID=2569760 RepID=A0A537IY98_9BACT|nr:MAG: type I methionyl aminopeptidase [Terrabacteria group bacterium ANGP1]
MTTRTATVILKTPAEIEQMRRAGVLAAEALREVVRAVRPGVTGTQLNAIAERYIRARGGTPSFLGYRGFPASICISVNDEVVHGIPDGMPLPDGALVSLDLGAVVGGFHGDVAVTVPVGQVEPRLHRLVAVTREALYRAIEVARPGKRLGDVGVAVQLSVVRDFAGHGIGRSLHEEPQIPNFGEPGTGTVLRDGMTLAIEPMVNLGSYEVVMDGDGWTVRTKDGQPSAHCEHTVAVTADGAMVLTTIPDGVI